MFLLVGDVVTTPYINMGLTIMHRLRRFPESPEMHSHGQALWAKLYIAYGANRGMGVLVEWGKVRKFVMGANSYNLC